MPNTTPTAQADEKAIRDLAYGMANAKIGEGNTVRCEGPTPYEVEQMIPSARLAIRALQPYPPAIERLLQDLRAKHGCWRYWDGEHTVFTSLPERAAEMVSRLAALRPEGEAVAWQTQGSDGSWFEIYDPELLRQRGLPVRALGVLPFASPPAPAGVKDALEAAALRIEREKTKYLPGGAFDVKRLLDHLAAEVRSLLPPTTEAQAASASTPAEVLPSQTSGAEAVGASVDQGARQAAITMIENDWSGDIPSYAAALVDAVLASYLSALPRSLPVCETCGGRGEIGGWDRGDLAYRTERCPDCSALAKPASEPAGGGVREALRTLYSAADKAAASAPRSAALELALALSGAREILGED